MVEIRLFIGNLVPLYPTGTRRHFVVVNYHNFSPFSFHKPSFLKKLGFLVSISAIFYQNSLLLYIKNCLQNDFSLTIIETRFLKNPVSEPKGFSKEELSMPLIQVTPKEESKTIWMLLETGEPVHSIAPAEEHLYRISKRQLELLKSLHVPFKEVMPNAQTRSPL